MLPNVIGLNGPPHSGKGWIVKNLLKLIPDAVVMTIHDSILESMRRNCLVGPDETWEGIKAQPDGRAKIIDHAQEERGRDPDVFSRIVVQQPEYQQARVVIYDNIGFQRESEWFDMYSGEFLLLRIDSPYLVPEPKKAQYRRLSSSWYNDSRQPAMNNNQLTAYDSLQMWHLLQWLAGPLTRDEAGPYYDSKSIWDRCFAARESTGDLFAQ